MKKANSLLLVLCLFLGVLNSQTTRGLQNSWLHLDKPFYVTDDALGFQLYLAPEFMLEEIVVQSILFDATGAPQLYAYWSNEGKSVLPGKLIVPKDMPTGWYYLSFRVWDDQRKTERVLLQAPLAIYNDQETIVPERVSQQEPSRQAAPVPIPAKELEIIVEDLLAVADPSSNIEFKVSVTDRRGRPVRSQVSISVNDWGLMGASQAMGMDNLQASDSLRVVTPAHLSKELYWQGELLTDNSGAAEPRNLYLLIGAREQSITTDTRNRIFWTADRGRGRLPVQLRTQNGEPARIRFRPAAGRLALGQLFYSPAAFRYLEISRQRKTLIGFMEDEQPLRPERYQNAADTDGLSALVGVDDSRELNWRYTKSTSPSATTLLWQTGQSGEDGRFTVNYDHPAETTTYRIDIVAQDETGRRGRKTVYYKVDFP